MYVYTDKYAAVDRDFFTIGLLWHISQTANPLH